jgi:hypothetical protein
MIHEFIAALSTRIRDHHTEKEMMKSIPISSFTMLLMDLLYVAIASYRRYVFGSRKTD